MINRSYKTKSPLLFIVFNRPDTTIRIFEKIKEAKPARLYIAADGPRENRSKEQSLCTQVRQITEQVDWDCTVKTLFRETNLGCKNAVSSAIDWFFQNEEEGIILEDDCLPANDFFFFCDELLIKYRHDTRVRHICGCNLQQGNIRGSASYYFANMTHVWGWASWKRVWKDYDKDLSLYGEDEVSKQMSKIFEEPLIVETWTDIFKSMKLNKIDTWDYQLAFINFFNNGLTAIPNTNLISNIGFREDATHTSSPLDYNANIPLGALKELTHPKYFLPEKEADYFTLYNDFEIYNRKTEIEAKIKKNKRLKYRLKRWIKSHR